jgi:hypothetical protein
VAQLQARSQRLIGHVSVTVPDTSRFTAPDGHVVLVKSAYYYNGATTPVQVILYATFPGATTSTYLQDTTIEPAALANWEGFVALNPADSISVYASDANVAIWVSGAVLSTTNQLPPA